MYVKKFEAETLDEALKSVKAQLGPDAIILKTVTNKGLKGAFKRGRIEITAAISEESYAKKAKVDKALGQEKERFYRAPSSSINEMINEYNEHDSKSRDSEQSGHGYGNMGLNRVVNTVSRASQKLKTSLDDFLTTEEESEREEQSLAEEFVPSGASVEAGPKRVETSEKYLNEGPSEYERRLKVQLDSQKKQIEMLEKKLFELSQNSYLSTNRKDDNPALTELRESLKTLELSDAIISHIIKKARFELSLEELRDEETLFDLALRELSSMINVEMALFSGVDESQEFAVTALISEHSSGQSSMGMKLAVLIGDAKVIRLRPRNKMKIEHEFATSVFGIDVVSVDTLSHLMTEARKGKEEGKRLLLDIRIDTDGEDESKKIIDTLRRSFKKLEIMMNLSAIHSEVYNKKLLTKYRDKVDGLVITHLDQCLNYGALVNAHYKFNKLPLKFFGTGGAIPDDVEAASAERILAGMFNL